MTEKRDTNKNCWKTCKNVWNYGQTKNFLFPRHSPIIIYSAFERFEIPIPHNFESCKTPHLSPRKPILKSPPFSFMAVPPSNSRIRTQGGKKTWDGFRIGGQLREESVYFLTMRNRERGVSLDFEFCFFCFPLHIREENSDHVHKHTKRFPHKGFEIYALALFGSEGGESQLGQSDVKMSETENPASGEEVVKRD